MSKFGANILCSATMGVGMKRLCTLVSTGPVCVCARRFSFCPEGLLEVCLGVFAVLGCVCVFFFSSSYSAALASGYC